MKKTTKILAIAGAIVAVAGLVAGIVTGGNIAEEQAAKEKKYVGTWRHGSDEFILRERNKCVFPYAEKCTWEVDKDDENFALIKLEGNDKQMEVTAKYRSDSYSEKLDVYGPSEKKEIFHKQK